MKTRKIFNSIIPYLFILPSAIFIFGLIYYPIIDAARISFYNYNFLSGEIVFIGLKNYIEIFKDQNFLIIFRRTIVWTFSVVSGTVIISLLFAILLDAKFKFKRLVRSILVLPWATSLAISAMIFKWGLNSDRGLINHTLNQILGLIKNNVGWLARGETAFPWLVFIGIWVSVPFTTLVVLAAMKSVPNDLKEAASIDGANFLQTYFKIELPLISPILKIMILMNFIVVFNSFPIIWIMTEGGPINSTDIIVTYLYKQAFKFLEFGKASAMAMIVFVVLLIISLLYSRNLMKESK